MSLTYLLVLICKLANEAVFSAGFPADTAGFPADTQPDSIAFWGFFCQFV